MRRILITGGGGFIGQALVRALYNDYEIVIFDDFHRGLNISDDIKNKKNIKILQGDILNYESLRRGINGVQIVFHLAAIAGVPTVVSKPYRTLKVNLIGTYNVLEAIKETNNVEHFIYFSTSEVYGPFVYKASEDDMTTQGPVSQPRWVYSVSKLSGEYLALGYAKECNMRVTIVRPFNIYGPGQIGEGAIHNFVTRAIMNEPIVVHGDGTQIRSWCYITDLLDAVLRILKLETSNISEVFNIGNPRATCSVLDLALRIKRLVNSKSEIIFEEMKYPEVEVRIPSIEKARRVLGFEPKVGLDEGIEETIKWYRSELIK